MKSSLAFILVSIFTLFMLLVSCGKSNPAVSEKDVPDSALTDSIPESGDYEYQHDLVPEGRTGQLDSIRDSVDRKQ